MSLLLRVVTLNDQPLSRPLIGRFDERGGQIGRADSATFTLPDPERMISREQARVLHEGGDYWVENVGAANPILHNGRPLSAGMRVALRSGDELRIGGYRMEVAFEDDETAATILAGRTVIAPRMPVATGETQRVASDVPAAVARIRAALDAALDRFDPVSLEAWLDGRAVIDPAVPIAGQVDRWSQYRGQYAVLREEALREFERVRAAADSGTVAAGRLR